MLALGSCAETVVAPATVQEVVVSGGGSALRLGQQGQLGVTLKADGGVTLPTAGVTWTSSDASVATVTASGQVTALKRGTATITASAQAASGTASVPVIGVRSVTVTPDSVRVIVTQSATLGVALDLDPGVTVTPAWVVRDTALATVSATGRVTAKGLVGATWAVATAEDQRDSALVRVIPVPVASVSVAPDTATRIAGQTAALTATAKDSIGGTLPGRLVTWSVSDTSRATVSPAGLVTTKAAGTVTVTATSEGKSGTATVTIRPAVARVVLSVDTLAVIVTQTRGLTAVPQAGDGTALTDRPVTWAATDTTVARVSSTGQVTGRSVGTTTVTATAEGKVATAVIRVVPVPVASVTVTPSTASVIAGQTQSFSAATLDSTGAVLTARSVVWSTSDPALATVSTTGVVTTVASGTVIVTATSEGKSGTATLTIKPPVARVELVPDTLEVIIGQSRPFTATPRDAAGNPLVDRSVAWATANAAVASVNQAGRVTGAGLGVTTVTATAEGRSATSVVRVVRVPVDTVTVVPASVLLVEGQSTQLTVILKDSVGGTLAGRTVTWTSTDTTKATVTSTGLVTAKAVGSAIVRVAVEGKLRDVPITVAAAPPTVASVAIAPDTLRVIVGQARPLTALPKDASGNFLADRTVSWSSANAGVATVSTTGLVIGVTLGQTTVTATSEGKSGSAVVIVVPVPVASVVVEPAAVSVGIGRSSLLRAVTKDSTGAILTGRSVVWASADTTKGTVTSSGAFLAKALGVVEVTATSEGKVGSGVVTVTTIGVDRVTVSPSADTLTPGQTVRLTATVLDDLGGVMTGRPVAWSTNAPAVATVSDSGLVTAVANGVATITATAEGKTATAEIRVTSIDRIEVWPGLGAYVVGDTGSFAFFPLSADGAVVQGAFGTSANGPEVIGGATECSPIGCVQRIGSRNHPNGQPPIIREVTVSDGGPVGRFNMMIFSNVADSVTMSMDHFSSLFPTGFPVSSTWSRGVPFHVYASLALSGPSYFPLINASLEVASGTASITRCIDNGRGISVQRECFVVTPTADGPLRLRVRQRKSDGGEWIAERTVTIGTPVDRVELGEPILKLAPTRGSYIDARVLDITGAPISGRSIQFISSDTSILQVEPCNGCLEYSRFFTAKRAGTVTVTASVDGRSATKTVEVADHIAGIDLSTSTAAFVAGDTGTIAFRGVAGDGTTVLLSGGSILFATGGVIRNVSCAANATACRLAIVVASHPTGAVPAAQSGEILPSASRRGAAFSAIAVSDVADSLVLSIGGVSPGGSLTVGIGDTLFVRASLFYAGGNAPTPNVRYDLTQGSGALTRCPAGFGEAQVQTDCVRLVASQVGTVKLRGRFFGLNGAVWTDELTIAVVSTRVGSVTITLPPGTATPVTLAAGQTLQLSATVRDESGAVLTDRAVVWGSSDASRVRVSATGLLTAVLPGAVTITAGADGRTATLAVTVPNPIVTVESGGTYSCALRLAGELSCWGNLGGVFGSSVPVRLASGIRWRSLSAGYIAMCGVAADSTGYCWGSNPYGGVGVSGTAGGVFAAPQVVLPGTKWAEIVASTYYTCGTRLPDRAMLCWGGAGLSGVEESPVPPGSATPQVVAGVPPLEQLSAGMAFVCGKEVGGARWYCFGGTGAESLNPVRQITSATGVTNVAPVGIGIGCFVSADSTAACFGSDVGTLAAPQAVAGGIKWRRFADGLTRHFCGIDVAGIGYCWGSNVAGQIGDGTQVNRTAPVPISGRWVRLAPGLGINAPGNLDHTCGLGEDGNVYCWGANNAGQIGDGTGTNALTPRAIVIP